MLTMFFSSLSLKIGHRRTQDISSNLFSVVFTVFLLLVNFQMHHFYIYTKWRFLKLLKKIIGTVDRSPDLLYSDPYRFWFWISYHFDDGGMAQISSYGI
jgi:hypothetical protein